MNITSINHVAEAKRWNTIRAMECAEIAFSMETSMRNSDYPWTEEEIEGASEALCAHFHSVEAWKDDKRATNPAELMADCMNILRAGAARAGKVGA